MTKTGVLLVNLGTPKSASIKDIRSYLNEFLLDKRVIDINFIFRLLLVKGFILPFRPYKIIKSYEKIWSKAGSPLLIHTENLAKSLQKELGSEFLVDFAMRYGNPGIPAALPQFKKCQRLLLIPLYPQYASSASGSTIAKVYEIAQQYWDPIPINVLYHFYNKPGFISSIANMIREKQREYSWDHLLFSYHGLPQRHMQKSACKNIEENCKKDSCPPESKSKNTCYRFQCYETTRLIANELDLAAPSFSVGFQSRLGRTPWITPYTDKMLEGLYQRGVRKLAVITPSFTSDCLETIEEIGIRLKEQWLQFSDTEFLRIECLNSRADWVQALAKLVKRI